MAYKPSMRMGLLMGLSGGFVYGYMSGVIGPALADNNCGNEDDFPLRHVLSCGENCAAGKTSLVSGSFIAGAMLANISGSIVGRTIGIRLLLVLSGIISLAGTWGNWFASDLLSFCVCRFSVGTGVGFISWGVPFFFSEFAPPASRGLVMGYFPLAIVGAIFFVYILGYAMSFAVCDDLDLQWRLLYVYTPSIPIVLFIIGSASEYISAKSYRVQINKSSSIEHLRNISVETEARASLSTCAVDSMEVPLSSEPSYTAPLLDDSASENMENDARFISTPSKDIRGRDVHNDNGDEKDGSLLSSQILFFAVGIAACQQLTGVNAIISYTPGIFQAAGNSNPFLSSVLSNGTNVVCTFLSGLVVDRIGRRPLLVGSLFVMTASLLLVSLFLLLINHSSGALQSTLQICIVPLIMAYFMGFALGPGPLFYLICAETFPAKVRDSAMAIANFFLFFFNLVTVSSFPFLYDGIGESGTFLLCGCVSICCCMFAFSNVKETKDVVFLPSPALQTRSHTRSLSANRTPVLMQGSESNEVVP